MTMTPAKRDRDLIQACLDGDQSAFSEFYRAHSAPVFTYLRSRVKNRAHAEEILQAVFVKAFENSRRLSLLENARPYLITIARNLITDHYRAARAAVPLDAESEAWLKPAAESADPGAPGETARVESALERLPAEQREVVVAYIYSGLNFREIAESFSISINTVIYRYRSALKKLKEFLDERI